MTSYHSKTEHRRETQATHFAVHGQGRTACGRFAGSLANIVEFPNDADCKACRRVIDAGGGEGAR